LKKDLSKVYARLMDKFKEMIVLSSASSLLGWDMMTMMPPKGINLRSQQLALLAALGHRMATDPEVGKLLDTMMQHSNYEVLDAIQKRNVDLIRKSYLEQVALPEELVTEMQRQHSIAHDVWRKAKTSNDWKTFMPELEKNVDLAKRAADILMKVKKTDTSYDALIDIYEAKMTAKDIDQLFTELRSGLIWLMDKIKNSPYQPDTSLLHRRIPIDLQRKISIALTQAVQYDVISKNAAGRIDETEHPFTTGYYDDVRITTHYYEDQFTHSLFSILHESGHALYEQQINPEWIFQPVGTACSMGIHESQSRFVENIVGRSLDFWTYFLPKLKNIAGDVISDFDLERFVEAINLVTPTKIRIEADEVTYGLHVIIRFNIEKDLFAGNISVKDLPEIWNQSYKEYLGVKIENYTEGILQDMHWASGDFGYFPCYALGNLYDGQLLAKMNQDMPNWHQDLAKDGFTMVKDWLGQNVHSLGNLYDPPELIKKITTKELTVEPYLKYLNDKYSRIYKMPNK